MAKPIQLLNLFTVVAAVWQHEVQPQKIV